MVDGAAALGSSLAQKEVSLFLQSEQQGAVIRDDSLEKGLGEKQRNSGVSVTAQ